jgi:hypothetical protein
LSEKDYHGARLWPNIKDLVWIKLFLAIDGQSHGFKSLVNLSPIVEAERGGQGVGVMLTVLIDEILPK